MRRLTFLFLVPLILSLPGVCDAESHVDSQVVCQVLPGADPDTVANSIGAQVIDCIEAANVFLMTYRKSVPVDSIVELLEVNPDVSYAQPNYIVKILLQQVSEPFVDETGPVYVEGSSPISYYGQYAIGSLLMDSAHMIRTGSGQVIAIIDGGLDNSHPLFAGRLHEACFDFIDVDYEPWVYNGLNANHGTFVAGIAARAAPDAQLMIVRSFTATGNGTSFSIAHGIYHAAEHGADVINMSFGMDIGDPTIGLAINDAFLNHGVVLVASAGNNGEEMERFPGSHPYVINVAAVDSNDIKADFSNYGLTVDCTAPGVSIYSSLCGGDTWGWWCGTSFSTPFAAGLAALVKSVFPDSTPAFIMDKVLGATDEIDDMNPGYEYFLGSGRLNFLNPVWLPGDANWTGNVNLGDVVFIVNYVFREGPAPVPPEAGDANCDGNVNVGDAVRLIQYVFRQGDPPGCD